MAHQSTPLEYKDALREDVSLKAQLCVTLYQATHKTIRLYRALLEPFGLTYSQYQVLLALWDLGTSTVGDLCAALDLETSTISPVLKRLDKLDYIHRFRDRVDERRVIVALTDKGHAFRAEAVRIRCRLLDATEASLPDMEELMRSLRQFSAVVDRVNVKGMLTRSAGQKNTPIDL